MRVSARGDYAVRAALGLAAAYPATVSAQALADEHGLPRKFLEAILSELRVRRPTWPSCGSPSVRRCVTYSTR